MRVEATLSSALGGPYSCKADPLKTLPLGFTLHYIFDAQVIAISGTKLEVLFALMLYLFFTK
jgi:hypothetical protein